MTLSKTLSLSLSQPIFPSILHTNSNPTFQTDQTTISSVWKILSSQQNTPKENEYQMGKKMKLPFLFKSTEAVKPSWPWRSCRRPRTLSFRTHFNNDIFRAIDSAYSESNESIISNSLSQCPSFSSVINDSAAEKTEEVIQRLRSDRLFFDLGETKSIMEVKEEMGFSFPLKESTVMSMESRDPYMDFKKSMEEMVEAHGMKEWKVLEELLSWYLKANGRSNHEFIIGAFVDLLIGLSFASSSSSSSSVCSCSNCNSPSSLLSFGNSSSSSSSCCSSSSFANIGVVSSVEIEEIDSTTPCLSSLLEDDEEIMETDYASS